MSEAPEHSSRRESTRRLLPAPFGEQGLIRLAFGYTTIFTVVPSDPLVFSGSEPAAAATAVGWGVAGAGTVVPVVSVVVEADVPVLVGGT